MNRIAAILVVASCLCAPGNAAAAAPVPPSGGQVLLRLHRMDGGQGDALVSNGIPLPPGWLPASTTASPPVRLRIGGQEVPLYAEVLQGRHPDGSAMAVLVQFVWPAAATGDALFEVGALSMLPARAKVPINGQLPAAAALPIDPDYLVSTLIVGPTVKRVPGSLSAYEAAFDQWGNTQWATYGADWANMNYYDRVLNHFAFWVRTGNPVLWERAARLAIDYRNGYLEANNFAATEYWAQLDGLALHYWLTGDERSREAVYKTAENLHRSRGSQSRLSNTAHPWMDNRNQAKVLSSKILSARLEAPPFGEVTNWAAQARDDLGWILPTQTAAGSFVFQSQCGQSNNFMSGMLASVLIQYAEYLAPDPRILPAVQKFQDWLWDSQWRPEAQAYNYYSGRCAGDGDAVPASDLNGFYLEAYGWLAARTGDPKYLQRGEATFAGMVATTWFDGTKQYNEAFQFSWRYLGYRR